jgi:hypothetical protein
LVFLLTNDVEPVEIDALDLTIVSSEMPRTAELERVWIDAPSIKPGKTVPVKLLVRTYRGDEVTQTVPVEIPVNASGSLTLLVADGARLTQWEQREIRRPQQARDVAQMVKAFNKGPAEQPLYIRLVSAMPAPSSRATAQCLPASVLAVLDGERGAAACRRSARPRSANGTSPPSAPSAAPGP